MLLFRFVRALALLALVSAFHDGWELESLLVLVWLCSSITLVVSRAYPICVERPLGVDLWKHLLLLSFGYYSRPDSFALFANN